MIPSLWELAGDRRLIMVLPGGGRGRRRHSVFRTDPWGRLFHSLDSTLTLARVGPAGRPADATLEGPVITAGAERDLSAPPA